MMTGRAWMVAGLLIALALAGCTDDDPPPPAEEGSKPTAPGQPIEDPSNGTSDGDVVPTYHVRDGDSIQIEYNSNGQFLRTLRFRITADQDMVGGGGLSMLNSKFMAVGSRPVVDGKVDWTPGDRCDDEVEFPLHGPFNQNSWWQAFNTLDEGTHEFFIATQTERFTLDFTYRSNSGSPATEPPDDQDAEPVEHQVELVPTTHKWTIKTLSESFNAEGQPPNSQASVESSFSLPTSGYFLASLEWSSFETERSADLNAGTPICASAHDEGGLAEGRFQSTVDLMVQGTIGDGTHAVKGHIDGDAGAFNGGTLDVIWMYPA